MDKPYPMRASVSRATFSNVLQEFRDIQKNPDLRENELSTIHMLSDNFNIASPFILNDFITSEKL